MLAALLSAAVGPLVATAAGARGGASSHARSAAAGRSVGRARRAHGLASQVTVSPLEGTPDASASTQISFLGGAGLNVSDVEAVGSLSGHHAGRLERYSTGTGESFIPTRPFQPGEHVSVSAHVNDGLLRATVRTGFDVAVQTPVSQAQFPPPPGLPPPSSITSRPRRSRRRP